MGSIDTGVALQECNKIVNISVSVLPPRLETRLLRSRGGRVTHYTTAAYASPQLGDKYTQILEYTGIHWNLFAREFLLQNVPKIDRKKFI